MFSSAWITCISTVGNKTPWAAPMARHVALFIRALNGGIGILLRNGSPPPIAFPQGLGGGRGSCGGGSPILGAALSSISQEQMR